mmetsp:Transcript_20583/g.23490  ORF Transcript_20583/g.23490 Transcript_20583/m.23490 type:complete len:394 (+) Transcript_20583:54-1235(+)
MSTTTTSLSSPPPSPYDDPTVTNPLEDCPPLRWGIIGCGRVSHDFVTALQHISSASVVGCATANSLEKAQTFATKHRISNHYGNYDDLLLNADIDIVYVGNMHSFRREIGEKCLLANKHTLLEKPFACSVKDAEYLINLAKEKKLFLMEGMWTRFFPAVDKARLLSKQIGDIVSVSSDFNFNAHSDSDSYPTSVLYNHKLGGGASFYVAPYPAAIATMFYEGRTPNQIKVVGQVDHERTGVDLQGAAVLSFPGQEKDDDDNNLSPVIPGAGVATLSFGMLCESAEETIVIGTKGRLKICSPCHCPTRVSMTLKEEGQRGESSQEVIYDYPLPTSSDDSTYFYPNSAGFCYEAAAVARCIASGKLEAPQYTLQETMLNITIIEEIRTQLGVKPI